MAAVLLEDDADPNFTHFAHREEFLKLLKTLLDGRSSGQDVGQIDDSVKAMGSIVSEATRAWLTAARHVPTAPESARPKSAGYRPALDESSDVGSSTPQERSFIVCDIAELSTRYRSHRELGGQSKRMESNW